MDSVALRLFQARSQAICDEMGMVLRRSSFSPNIKDRLDFSCALFDARGEMLAQAAHIPVHLGSMAFAMRDVVRGLQWQPGDVAIWNDPFLGGTHLPDVTVVSPVFVDDELVAFAANRAHHANIGASEPGSMPLSRTLHEEGVVIAPQLLLRGGSPVASAMALLAQVAQLSPAQAADQIQDVSQWQGGALADFHAQAAAAAVGVTRTQSLVGRIGLADFVELQDELNAYARRMALAALATIPPGVYRYVDYLDDDGLGHQDLPIAVALQRVGDTVEVDFEGTCAQTEGNVNCPLSVTAAAVFYVFRCLVKDDIPACAGAFSAVRLKASLGLLVNAERPAAVAAGNVETSMRIVDALLGALAQALPDVVPAAGQGTMNNLALGAVRGDSRWDYYETIAGGAGGSNRWPGQSARHSHMTNTLNTPVEVLERTYPMRVQRYAIRRGSGGAGRHAGGDGVEREIEFLEPARLTVLSERRRRAPWGLQGGEAGAPGENLLNGSPMPGKFSIDVKAGDRLTIRTPGGGGYGN